MSNSTSYISKCFELCFKMDSFTSHVNGYVDQIFKIVFSEAHNSPACNMRDGL